MHILPPEAGLPYQIFARDSSVMTPWGAIIMQLQKPYRHGEIASVLRFYLDNDIPIYDMVSAGNVEGGDFMVLKPYLVDWLKAKGIRVLPVPYGHAMQLGANIVAPGGGRVLIPASSRNLIAMCKAEGLEVYDPDVSMIALGGGAVHCMCLALRRDPA